MKIKKSEVNILIMLIGILLAVLAYFVVYYSFTEKKDILAAENATLQSEVDELQKLADNKQFYIDETNRMDNEIQDILSTFPGEIRQEDQVMYAAGFESMYSNTIWVNGLSIDDTQLVQIAAPAAEQAAPTDDAVVEDTGDGTANDAVVATGGLKDTVFLYSSPFTLNYKITYRSFKDVVQLILSSDERMSIQNINLSYDSESGCLTGSLDATMYTVSGTDYIYKELDIPGVRMGTSDIFKSGTVLDLSRIGGGASGDGNSESEDENSEGEDENSEGGEEASDEEVTGN